MIKLFFLVIFLLAGAYPLKAEETLEKDQEFMNGLENVKNPFEDGLPPPVVVEPVHQDQPQPVALPTVSEPVKIVPPQIRLPDLKLQGVIVGEEVHQAIINDLVVPLHGSIGGARLEEVSKLGVVLIYKGKKFILKIE